MNCSALNAHLFIRKLVESPNCICGITETVSHFLLDCPCHTTLRQQVFFSLLDIPETIWLNLLIFGSVNLNDKENKAVFKSVQTFIIKSKRCTPWHAYIILFTFSILFNLFLLLFSSKLCSFQLHATYILFCPSMYKWFSQVKNLNQHAYMFVCDICMFFIGNRFKKIFCLFLNPIVELLLFVYICQLYQ